MSGTRLRGLLQPVAAGLVATLVGFAGTSAVVTAGLREVGASKGEVSSALFALCLAVGLLAVGPGWLLRMPIGIAWSTPDAACSSPPARAPPVPA